MKATFNLIDEPWIPCVPIDGGPTVERSIAEVLTNASAYREIYDNSPLVTVSLHRLLLAILYRVCGPKNLGEARTLVREGLPVEAIRSYLGKWHDRFDLFDEEHPFYQTAGMDMARSSGLSRLATEVNFGGIFDHTSDVGSPAYSPADAARLLVAAQSFALGFGKSGSATINGAKIDPPYSVDAILLRGITVWLAGKDLSETLTINLCPCDHATGSDVPAWELDAPHELRDTLVQGQRRTHSARGIADRYTWQSRLLRLIPEMAHGKTSVREVYFTQGRNADKSPEDPMKAYARGEEEGFAPISLSISRASWRDSHSMFATNREVFRRPGMFDLAAHLLESGVIAPDATYTVNVVGLATAPKKPGKFILWRHDRLPTPAVLLKDMDLVERLGNLLASADQAEELLWDCARAICAAYLSVPGKTVDRDAVTQMAREIDPRRSYWARMEGHFYALLRELPQDKDAASERWRAAVEREAKKALKESADQLGQSARAIRARALVNPSFRPRANNACNGETDQKEVIA